MCSREDSIEMIWDGIPILFVFVSPVEAPWKIQSKNTQNSHTFKLFQHLWGPRCVRNGMSNQTQSDGVYEFMWTGAWPTTAFSKGGVRYVWCGGERTELREGVEERGGEFGWVILRWGFCWRLPPPPSLALYSTPRAGRPLDAWCLLAGRKEEPLTKRSGKPRKWGGRRGGGGGGSESEEFDLTEYEESDWQELLPRKCLQHQQFLFIQSEYLLKSGILWSYITRVLEPLTKPRMLFRV